MPTYEYECTKCEAVTEVFQPITAPNRRKLRRSDSPACDCNAPVFRRIGTGGGIIFKGSGFYQTDYRSESYKKDAEADKPKSDKSRKSDGEKKKDTSPKKEAKSPAKDKAKSKTPDAGE